MSIVDSSHDLVTVTKHYNSRKRFDYWLVACVTKIPEDHFRRAYGRCVEMRGWYARAWDGIPAGFGFRAESVAEEFADWFREAVESIPEEEFETSPRAEDATPKTRVPSRPSAPRPAEKSPAAKFRQMAEAMQSTIDAKLAPMSQGWTPKRGREYSARVHEGHDLERVQTALRALADAWDAGAVPEILRGIRAKSEIAPMVHTRSTSNGYYEHIETSEFADQSPRAVALRALMDGAKSEHDLAREAEEKERREIEQMVDRLRGVRIEGFFPTPESVVEIMLDRADIGDGHRVLEPSAGIGSIAEAIRGSVTLTLCEIRPSLVEILKKKGFANIVDGDFLEQFLCGEQFDRIVLNPPFERRQDEKHIRRAYELLADGGRMVAIATPNGSDEFECWLSDVGADVDPLPAKAFDNVEAFNRTGVSTRLIVITK